MVLKTVISLGKPSQRFNFTKKKKRLHNLFFLILILTDENLVTDLLSPENQVISQGRGKRWVVRVGGQCRLWPELHVGPQL